MPAPTNFHTHTSRCMHASGRPIDYAREAQRAGMAVLGIADHTPLVDGRMADCRMAPDELEAYIADVAEARAAVPAVEVLLGMECDDAPERRGWYRDVLLGRHRFSYLIGALHEAPGRRGWINGFTDLHDDRDLAAYADAVVDAIASGLYAFIAHPDICGISRRRWDAQCAAAARAMCEASRAHGVPLEINGYGLRKPAVEGEHGPRPGYPWEPFWEVAGAVGCPVVVNSDAHRPQDVAAGLAECAALAARYGLTPAQPRVRR